MVGTAGVEGGLRGWGLGGGEGEGLVVGGPRRSIRRQPRGTRPMLRILYWRLWREGRKVCRDELQLLLSSMLGLRASSSRLATKYKCNIIYI